MILSEHRAMVERKMMVKIFQRKERKGEIYLIYFQTHSDQC